MRAIVKIRATSITSSSVMTDLAVLLIRPRFHRFLHQRDDRLLSSRIRLRSECTWRCWRVLFIWYTSSAVDTHIFGVEGSSLPSYELSWIQSPFQDVFRINYVSYYYSSDILDDSRALSYRLGSSRNTKDCRGISLFRSKTDWRPCLKFTKQ